MSRCEGQNVPFVRSQNITLSEGLVAQLLATLNTRPSAGLLVNPRVHLWTGISGNLTPQSTPQQFVEANFVGYSAVNLPSLIGPIFLPGGEGYGMHAEADFLSSATQPPGQNVLGYWIDDGGDYLYAAERFATQIPIANLGDFVSLDVVFGIDTPANVS